MSKFDNIKKLIVKDKLKLDCGQTISDFPIAYETYGELNSKKDNAILVFHALTGDQFASDVNPITKKDGWWKYALGVERQLILISILLYVLMFWEVVWDHLVQAA